MTRNTHSRVEDHFGLDLDTNIAIDGDVGTYTDGTALHDVIAPWRLAGPLGTVSIISPTQLVANTDNWNPTGLDTADVIRLSTDASRNITGIVAPDDTRSLMLVNIGAQNAVLKHDATSSSDNRFYGPNSADVTLRPNGWVAVWYDFTSARWRIMGA